jgi:hypothetical protein
MARASTPRLEQRAPVKAEEGHDHQDLAEQAEEVFVSGISSALLHRGKP